MLCTTAEAQHVNAHTGRGGRPSLASCHFLYYKLKSEQRSHLTRQAMVQAARQHVGVGARQARNILQHGTAYGFWSTGADGVYRLRSYKRMSEALGIGDLLRKNPVPAQALESLAHWKVYLARIAHPESWRRKTVAGHAFEAKLAKRTYQRRLQRAGAMVEPVLETDTYQHGLHVQGTDAAPSYSWFAGMHDFDVAGRAMPRSWAVDADAYMAQGARALSHPQQWVHIVGVSITW